MYGYHFNGDGALYWDLPTSIAGNSQFCFGCMHRRDAAPLSQSLMMCIVTKDNSNGNMNHLGFGVDEVNKIFTRVAGPTLFDTRDFAGMTGLGSWSITAWNHYSDHDDRIFDPNRDSTANMMNVTMDHALSTWDRVTIGGRVTKQSGSNLYCPCDIVQPFVFRRTLTHAELMQILDGLSPMDLDPARLWFYADNLCFPPASGNALPATIGNTISVARGLNRTLAAEPYPRTNFADS